MELRKRAMPQGACLVVLCCAVAVALIQENGQDEKINPSSHSNTTSRPTLESSSADETKTNKSSPLGTKL